MTDIPASTLFNIFLFLLVPFSFALFARKFKTSLIVGYIIGGLILGNVFGAILNHELINAFAYFGVILLLFTVGLEVNFKHIISLKKFILLGGFLQITLTLIIGSIIAFLFGFSPLKSFLIGIALTSSSTTLVAKIIQDRGEESSFVGELAIGILMFQDLAFIPFLIIVNTLGGDLSFWPTLFNIFFGIIKAAVIIGLLFYLGKKIVPLIFDKITNISRELLNIFIILFIIFITYLSSVLHVPILIGVFIAGILVSQTLENTHIFSEIRPFRDILAVIFFVFIGLNIKFEIIAPNILNIILFTLTVILTKFLIILFIFLFMKFHTKTAFNLSSYLFQIGEVAFILTYFAFQNKLMTESDYLFIATSVLFTLTFTPIFINNKDVLYKNIRGFLKKYVSFLENYINTKIDQDKSPIDELGIRDHVVICGYGRVGGDIGRALMLSNIPFIAIDYNFHIVQRARKQGVNIVYGDPTDINILDYAETDNANIIISALPDTYSQEAIVLNAKKLNPKILVISRIHKKNDQQRLKDLGVDIIIHPEFEASISIIKKILCVFHMSKDDIVGRIKRMRIEHGMI